MNSPDPVLTALMAAVARGHDGDRAGARHDLDEIWRTVGDDGDPAHRCILAHYLADLQESPEAELAWDERAMAAASELTDTRLQQVHPGLSVRGFLPSLHLNLADDRRMLGQFGPARDQLAAAVEAAADLPDDAYGRHLRGALRHVADALDAGSTERLPTHP